MQKAGKGLMDAKEAICSSLTPIDTANSCEEELVRVGMIQRVLAAQLKLP